MLNRAVSSSFASLRFDEQIGENGDIVKDKFRRQPALFQRFERRFSRISDPCVRLRNGALPIAFLRRCAC